MKIYTRDFGEVDVAEEDIITFVQPIYGFETLSKYVFLYDQNNSHIVWLQSAEEKDICFILIDPAIVDPGYKPDLPPSIENQLGKGGFMLWLVTVIAAEFLDSTVNMKSPIVVNPATKRAMQLILEEDLPIRGPLLKNRRESR